ncbi:MULTISPECIES: YceI family protein [Flavobacterium]|uniref:YceI family protein n=1 Tax=Flavobacterium hankyongi TaxID=1176532 RepID=A0ABP8ZWM0_9FLAO|nr:YceI family protein [Flavobacterium sp. N1846]
MRNLKSIALALVIALGTLTASAQTTKKVDASKSKVLWLAKKVGGQHNGDVNLKEGALVFNGKKLVGGNFTVDMTSINTTDLQGEYKGKLDGHLKADDFFAVEKFPTSTLVFKSIGAKAANTYTVTADLTIKGITAPVTFDIVANKGVANATVMIDRTKYDIKYASKNFGALADKAIDDEFELKVNLKY